MPIYEFECKQCGKKFERLIFASDDKKPACPDCNHEDVQKIMSSGNKVTLKVPSGYSGGSSCAPTG